MTDSPAETSDEVRARIAAARAFAVQMRPHTAMHLNAKLGASDIQKEIELNGHVQAVLTQAMERQKLSARGFHKILRVAAQLLIWPDQNRLTGFMFWKPCLIAGIFCLVR